MSDTVTRVRLCDGDASTRDPEVAGNQAEVWEPNSLRDAVSYNRPCEYSFRLKCSPPAALARLAAAIVWHSSTPDISFSLSGLESKFDKNHIL